MRKSKPVKRKGGVGSIWNNPILLPPLDERVVFTKDDYFEINLLNPSEFTAHGEFEKKTVGRECCWRCVITVATIPSIYYHEEDFNGENSNYTHWSEVNCDVVRLQYVHEGICQQKFFKPIMGKIFISYIENHTHLIMASARIYPMKLADRLRDYGPFKTSINYDDELDINFWYDKDLPLNSDFIDRPFTYSP